MMRALAIAPHAEDAPYLALALQRGIALWSNDKGMRAQSDVRIYTTRELLVLLAKP